MPRGVLKKAKSAKPSCPDRYDDDIF